MSTTYSIYLKGNIATDELAQRLRQFGALVPDADGSLGFTDNFNCFVFETSWQSRAEIRNYRLHPDHFHEDEHGYGQDMEILFWVNKFVGSVTERELIVEVGRQLAKEFKVIVAYEDNEVALYANGAPGSPLARHPEYAGTRNEWEWLPDGTYLGTLYAIYIDAPGLNSIDIAERLMTLGADSYEHDDDPSDDRTHLQWSWMPKSDVWNVGHWPLFFNEPGHGDGYEFRIAFHILQTDDTHESRDRVVAIANELAREFQTLVVYDDSEVALYENRGPGTPLAKLDEYRGLRSEWIYDEEGRYLRSSEDN